jgi:hypothetical protein
MVEPSVDIADRDPILTAAVGFETLEFLTRQMRAKHPEGFVLCAKRALESGYLALQTDNMIHDTPPAPSYVSPLLALATAVFACARAIHLVEAMASAAVFHSLLLGPCKVTRGLSRQPLGLLVLSITGLI